MEMDENQDEDIDNDVSGYSEDKKQEEGSTSYNNSVMKDQGSDGGEEWMTDEDSEQKLDEDSEQKLDGSSFSSIESSSEHELEEEEEGDAVHAAEDWSAQRRGGWKPGKTTEDDWVPDYHIPVRERASNFFLTYEGPLKRLNSVPEKYRRAAYVMHKLTASRKEMEIINDLVKFLFNHAGVGDKLPRLPCAKVLKRHIDKAVDRTSDGTLLSAVFDIPRTPG